MLPIHAIEGDFLRALRDGNRVVLTAPTGSGKTTQVPQMLHRAGLAAGRVLVLQPRRLATRLVAERVAKEMGVALGGEVGYQTRHDRRAGPRTRILFLTEGLFLRILLGDPRLRGVAAVVLDEFHERSLAADTALALVKRLQETVRPDLRLVVMSATLDAAAVSGYLGCPALEAGGRLFPVAVHYLEKRSQAPAWDLAADALAAVLGRGEPGDVLVFMPGAYEIRRTMDACRRVGEASAEPLAVLPLHGELPPREQDRALQPADRRRVIVSTNVAQTSLTIEGVRFVIDSGLARVHRFDPRRGINVLLVEPISQAAAEQRAGRAGRTAPGECYRLWTPAEGRARPAHDTPEVRRLDLAEVVLSLAAMGVADPRGFPWVEPPAPAAVDAAAATLRRLGALTSAGGLTPTGRVMAGLPMHPRLSRMLVEAARRGCPERGALWAALLSERDVLTRPPSPELASAAEGPWRSDLVVLERGFARAEALGFDPARCEAEGLAGGACREVARTRRLFADAARAAARETRAPTADAGDDLAAMLKALLAAFPDHVALRRSEAQPACGLVGGRRGVLDARSVARRPGLLLPVEVREVGAGVAADAGVKTVLSVVSEIEPAWLEELFPDRVTDTKATAWNEKLAAVEELEGRRFDDLVFEETARPATDHDAAARLLAELACKGLKGQPGGLRLEGWDERVEGWIARTRAVAAWFPERGLITYNDDDLLIILQEVCAGAVRYSQVKNRPCYDAVRGALSWEDQQFVERMAPERIELPRGWRMKLDYAGAATEAGAEPPGGEGPSGGGGASGGGPRGRAKIQDLYGLERTPLVAGGRRRVRLEILGPNFRPLQVTEDLEGFWKNLYPTLKRELARKYPRHEWR